MRKGETRRTERQESQSGSQSPKRVEGSGLSQKKLDSHGDAKVTNARSYEPKFCLHYGMSPKHQYYDFITSDL